MSRNILENGSFEELEKYFNNKAETDIITLEELELIEFNSDIVIVDNGGSGKYYNKNWYSIYKNDPDNNKDYEYYISLELEELMEEPQFDIYC